LQCQPVYPPHCWAHLVSLRPREDADEVTSEASRTRPQRNNGNRNDGVDRKNVNLYRPRSKPNNAANGHKSNSRRIKIDSSVGNSSGNATNSSRKSDNSVQLISNARIKNNSSTGSSNGNATNSSRKSDNSVQLISNAKIKNDSSAGSSNVNATNSSRKSDNSVQLTSNGRIKNESSAGNSNANVTNSRRRIVSDGKNSDGWNSSDSRNSRIVIGNNDASSSSSNSKTGVVNRMAIETETGGIEVTGIAIRTAGGNDSGNRNSSSV